VVSITTLLVDPTERKVPKVFHSVRFYYIHSSSYIPISYENVTDRAETGYLIAQDVFSYHEANPLSPRLQLLLDNILVTVGVGIPVMLLGRYTKISFAFLRLSHLASPKPHRTQPCTMGKAQSQLLYKDNEHYLGWLRSHGSLQIKAFPCLSNNFSALRFGVIRYFSHNMVLRKKCIIVVLCISVRMHQ